MIDQETNTRHYLVEGPHNVSDPCQAKDINPEERIVSVDTVRVLEMKLKLQNGIKGTVTSRKSLAERHKRQSICLPPPSLYGDCHTSWQPIYEVIDLYNSYDLWLNFGVST